MAQTREHGQCCELTHKKDLMKWMETLPQCGFFFCEWSRGHEKKEKRKSYIASKEMKIRYTATDLPKKNLNTSLKASYTAGGLFVSLFFKTPQRGNISRNCSYLYIHSLLFQSMKNKWKSQVKGGVDFILLSLSTSPRPTPPFDALPQLLDSSPPLNPACDGQSHRAAAWVGWNLLVDIAPLFIFQ